MPSTFAPATYNGYGDIGTLETTALDGNGVDSAALAPAWLSTESIPGGSDSAIASTRFSLPD